MSFSDWQRNYRSKARMMVFLARIMIVQYMAIHDLC